MSVLIGIGIVPMFGLGIALADQGNGDFLGFVAAPGWYTWANIFMP
jgi:hypothetical protein